MYLSKKPEGKLRQKKTLPSWELKYTLLWIEVNLNKEF